MDENASERGEEWDVKLSRGGYALNEPDSEMTTVAQSALDTVNPMGDFKFAGVSAIFESIAVESPFHLPSTSFHLRHPVWS